MSYKQTATMEITIPRNNEWTIGDIKEALQKKGIECKVVAVMNHLDIPNGLIKPKRRGKINWW